ncbi:DUF1642 domain-containing protein, partial [Enterococcus hirae]|nr:DUF1642 domain-containing protein [Enterococcus hirae]
KQELIRKYYAERAKLRPYCPNRNRKEEQFKSTIYTNIIDDLNQLDEPQKKVIPKCAHEFILEGTDLGLSYFEIITSAESFANAKPQDEFSKWLRKNSGLFIRSLLNGYEVEKEQLYCVKIGKGYFSGFDETKVTYVIDDAPGALAQRVKYETREEAEMDAIQIGGTVEEVVEE